MIEFGIFGDWIRPFPKFGAAAPSIEMIANTGHNLAPDTVGTLGKATSGHGARSAVQRGSVAKWLRVLLR
ncbi:hypothetical protein OO25_10970 [Phaeobacter sp. S60]|nr:hypothetical protein OO25_10970 [Phaeobacter sp. S60]